MIIKDQVKAIIKELLSMKCWTLGYSPFNLFINFETPCCLLLENEEAHSSLYHLIAADITQIKQLEDKLLRAGLKPRYIFITFYVSSSQSSAPLGSIFDGMPFSVHILVDRR